MTMREIHILRTHEEIAEARLKEDALIAAENGEIAELLSRARAEANKMSPEKNTKSHNYYARDKYAMEGDWHAWLKCHSRG